jgi:hypothetical protein
VFNSGGTLHIESSVVNGFKASGAPSGILINAPGNIFVEDTIARGNSDGITVFNSTPGTVSLSMDRLHLDANGTALALEPVTSGAIVQAAIRDSSISGNVSGVFVDGVQNAVASVDIEICLITNNSNNGVAVAGLNGGSGTASVSNCTISRNTSGAYI